MGFKLPQYLNDYLNTKYSSPFHFWVNSSLYYAGLSSYYINYMNNVVRPCVAYASGVKDGSVQSCISANIGYSVKKTAVKLIKGDKVIFNGDNEACRFLDDIWSKKTRFAKFIGESIDFTASGGTAAVKLNVDRNGRSSLSAIRVDRYYATTSESGEVVEAIFFLNLLAKQQSEGQTSEFWLVEHRYLKGDIPFVVYKVHTKSGTAGADVLPNYRDAGIPKRSLSPEVQNVIERLGIKLNTPLILPFKNKIGVWQTQWTSSNSCIPGANMGDPMLYGSEDILWSIDTVFSGSVIDVLNGEGKILVPSKFLNEVKATLANAGISVSNIRTESWKENDDSLVYISTDHDKDFPPQSVQFNIRAESYKAMLDMYLHILVTNCGFTPTSVFPFLADNSAKTATEVNAEENLTRATIQDYHTLNLPVINEALEEVLRLEGFKGTATIQLSDYIGNKIQSDANLRANYESGALPQEVFVQKINNISVKETEEYCSKINQERKERQSLPFTGIEEVDYV